MVYICNRDVPALVIDAADVMKDAGDFGMVGRVASIRHGQIVRFPVGRHRLVELSLLQMDQRDPGQDGRRCFPYAPVRRLQLLRVRVGR